MGGCYPCDEIPEKIPKENPHLLSTKDVKLIKKAHRFYFNAGYLVSANSKNSNSNKTLFADNGMNLGLSYGLELKKQFGIITHINYNFGKTNQEGVTTFAKETTRLSNPFITQKNTNWSQVEIMTGVDLKPMLKTPLFFDLTAGVGINPNANTITIRESQQTTTNLFSTTEKSTSFVWNARASYIITKKQANSHLFVFAGYGSKGFTGGVIVSLASSCCFKACCCAPRFCEFCCPKPEPEKPKGK